VASHEAVPAEGLQRPPVHQGFSLGALRKYQYLLAVARLEDRGLCSVLKAFCPTGALVSILKKGKRSEKLLMLPCSEVC